MTEYSDGLPASKSQRKRDVSELQELGLSIMELKDKDRQRLPLSAPLEHALVEARRIHSNEARRRHAQYIGRLIRESDSELIIQAMNALHDPMRQQRLTQWTEQIIAAEHPREADGTVQQILDFFPHGDRQQLRSLARNLFKARIDDPSQADEQQKQRFKRERRKLMSYLNELDKTAPLY